MHLHRRLFTCLLSAAACIAITAASANATVSLTISDNDATPTARTVPAGTSFDFTVRLVSTAEQTTGIDYYLTSSDATGLFTIVNRNTTGGAYNDPLYYTDTTVEGSPSNILNPRNDHDLGGLATTTQNAGTIPVATYTIAVSPSAPIGTYTISTTVLNANEGWIDTNSMEHAFNSHGTFTVNVPEPSTLVGLAGLALGAIIRRRPLRRLSLIPAGRISFAPIVVVIALLAPFCAAHDPLLDLPPPNSVPEAWNVINASVDNVAKLLETNQLREIAFQIANCSPAIRTLQANLPADETGDARRAELAAMFKAGAAIIEATREKDRPREKGEALFPAYRQRWETIAKHYSERERNATVYVCPMHPLDRHLEVDAACTACGMSLIRRRIPASTTYEKPGDPSMKLIATPDRPLQPGRKATVIMRLSRLDGTPMREEDLAVMHTERIHMLIVDRSLADYHHEHPTPTETPGEYVFSFTPRRPGPYRAWADVVPGASAVQEFVVTDIPGRAEGEPLTDRQTKMVDVVDGLRYELTWDNKGSPLRVGEVVKGRVTLTDREGKPFRQLEPIMGAYAHLVGFAEDYRTVIHLHPLGQEPKRPTDRGGPTFDFRFYPPTAGFIRFYSQVNVGGASKFAQFGITVEPATPAAAQTP